MGIPAFEASGYLPPGRHVTTGDEMRAVLVDNFAASATRSEIFDKWKAHRTILSGLVALHEQWIGGSFVSSKVDPSDIDVCSIFDGAAFDALGPAQQAAVLVLCGGPEAGARWKCDSYPVPIYPPNHPAHDACKKAVQYWHDFWSRTREDADGNVVNRGYLAV